MGWKIHSQEASLKGVIKQEIKIKGCLNKPANLTGKILVAIDYDYYSGEYEVTPEPREAIVLETRDKVVSQNIVVNKIPYFETSNESGETVYIGGF